MVRCACGLVTEAAAATTAAVQDSRENRARRPVRCVAALCSLRVESEGPGGAPIGVRAAPGYGREEGP
jgi:hypothetical protein